MAILKEGGLRHVVATLKEEELWSRRGERAPTCSSESQKEWAPLAIASLEDKGLRQRCHDLGGEGGL